MSLEFNRKDFKEALISMGISSGDTLYVASSMVAFYHWENPCVQVIELLREVLGDEGTLIMPGFNFGFCKGEPFDREHTPTVGSVLTEAFRILKGTYRSWAPPYHNILANGKLAQAMTTIESNTSFGVDSVFQKLIDMDVKHLLIGCMFNQGVTHFHLLEEQEGVPYRYWKRLEGEVLLDGKVRRLASRMYAREDKAIMDVEPLVRGFEKAGSVSEEVVGLCHLRVFGLKDFDRYFRAILRADPYAFLDKSQSDVENL